LSGGFFILFIQTSLTLIGRQAIAKVNFSMSQRNIKKPFEFAKLLDLADLDVPACVTLLQWLSRLFHCLLPRYPQTGWAV
jgi:hypothetical protein